jgi:peptidoglycan/xylan/chitin deacetylase (PgdA/CDA1 family)
VQLHGSFLATSPTARGMRNLSAESPVCLLYHGVPPRQAGALDATVLERHIIFLKRHFDIVRIPHRASAVARSAKPRVAITFDDGYRNNAEVVAPILRRHRVPATFFVCTRHSRKGKFLWFSHLSALNRHFRGNGFRFHDRFIDMSSTGRAASMKRLRDYLLSLRPHPLAMYQEIENHLPAIEDLVDDHDVRAYYAGLTEQQIADLAKDELFSVQPHTEDHPFLTSCTPSETQRQLSDNKTWVEQLTQRDCDVVAYPSGNYDRSIVNLCMRLGFRHGFAVISNRVNAPSFEVPRIGVYSTSLNVLAVKASCGHLIRSLRLQVG